MIDTLPGGAERVLNPGPAGWSDSTGWRLVEEGRFSGKDGTPSELGQPQSIAVDEWGRVYVVEGKPASIKVYSESGALVRTMSRDGEGPGELRSGFVAVHGGWVVVHDPALSRTSVWDTAGTFLRSWRSACCYYTAIGVDRAGRIYVPQPSVEPGERSRGRAWVRYTVEGATVDTVWAPHRESGKEWTVQVKEGGQVVRTSGTSVPYQPLMTRGLHPDGGFVYGWSADYQLIRTLTGLDTVRVFSRTWTPDPLSDEARKATVEARIKDWLPIYDEATLRAVLKVDDLPTTVPAFSSIRVDGKGNTWVRRTPVEHRVGTLYDVFDTAGVYLGPVSLGVYLPQSPQAWGTDRLVVVMEDREGRPAVVRFKILAGRVASP